MSDSALLYPHSLVHAPDLPRHCSFAPWIPEAGGDYDMLVVTLQESSYKQKPEVDEEDDEDISGTGAPTPTGDVLAEAQKRQAKNRKSKTDPATSQGGAAATQAAASSGGGAASPDAAGRGRSTTKAARSVATSSCDIFDSIVAYLGAELPTDGDVATMRTPFKYFALEAAEGEKTAAGLPRHVADKRAAMLRSYNQRRSISLRPRLAGRRSLTPEAQGGEGAAAKEDALANKWVVAERLMLGANSGFVVEIGLMLLVRRRLVPHINSVCKDSEATGILGVVANKGGVGIGATVYGTPLVFVGSHLAAHMHFLDARNQNVEEILAGMHLGNPDMSADVQAGHCFWAGDLNYRLDQDLLGPDGAKGGNGGKKLKKDKRSAMHLMTQGLIDQECWQDLMAADQLKWSQQQGLAFVGFQEGAYTFPPTFKVERAPGFQYQPKRVQSYCDRVLWRSLPQLQRDVRCEEVAGHASITTSDHKPVSASFQLTLRAPPLLSPCPPTSAPIIEFGDISASDVMAADVSGKSDPYVRFFSYPPGLLHPHKAPSGSGNLRGLVDYAPGLAPHTGFVKQTLNPKWNVERQVPNLRLNVTNRLALSRCHLLLVLMDYDALDSHDPIGTAVVDLSPLLNSNTLQFVEGITFNSRREGTLSGSLRVVWPGDDEYARVSAPKDTGGCCGEGAGCCSIQ